MNYARLTLVMLATVMALPVFADGLVDDCIKLAQGGVGEEVVVAWAERQGGGNLSAADILRLKDGKVPDRAIATLIRSGSRVPMMHGEMRAEQPQIQTVPAQHQTVAYEPTTTCSTCATPATSYVYTDSYPTYSYYGGYPYYSSYYYPRYYGYYGYGYPGFGLSFNFGRGGYYGGYRGGYYGGYRGGYYGGYSGGYRGGFSGGFSTGYRGGFSSGSHGGRR